ncbi:MAG: butyrate kinase [Candidatus Adiutrix sp.]|jgi:butyrate kinase|nr:butyrate kinase [Candidatus Adiutrix sp.]
MAKELILVLNPGSTSTKVALYEGEKELDSQNLPHPPEELEKYPDINDQLGFRRQAILDYLKERRVGLGDLAAIAARGGVVGQLESGAHLVDEAFARASLNSPQPHPANLSPVIARELAEEAGIKAYVYDPVCACGRAEDLISISGLPELPRPFLTHVLNSRAVAIEQARRDGRELSESVYIVSHLGGGITTNLIRHGRVYDIVADDEGAFSPERAGGLPARYLARLCYSGRYSESEMRARLKGRGGLMAYLGTNDLIEAEKKIEAGDRQARLVVEAMALQISKDIASLYPVVDGKVDKTVLTGGLAHSRFLTGLIKQRCAFLGPMEIMAGTFEMPALALGVLRVLRGREEAHINKF